MVVVDTVFLGNQQRNCQGRSRNRGERRREGDAQNQQEPTRATYCSKKRHKTSTDTKSNVPVERVMIEGEKETKNATAVRRRR